MTSARIRWSFLLIAGLILSGCSPPAKSISTTAAEDKFFKEGLNQYINSGDLTTLQQVPKQYPQGEWRNEAELLIKMAMQLAQREKKDQALASCQQKRNALIKDNKNLEETLKQLKEVLIDTELKAK